MSLALIPRLTGLGLAAMLAVSGCASTPDGEGVEDPAVSERKANIHYEMGVQQLKEGQTPQAIGSLLLAVQLNPDNAPIHFALGEAYRRKGRMQEAEHHLARAVELDPGFQQARLTLSSFYSQLERYEEARQHAAVLTEDPTFPWPWRALTNLGWAEYRLGDAERAREHLQLALDYRADYWRARLNLGIVAADQKQFREAVTQFEQVLAEQPGPFAEAEVHYRLAELYMKLGQREQAIAHLSESANRRPSGPWGERSATALKKLR